MLDDNPFLELASDEAPREEFGLDRADAAPERDAHALDDSHYSIADSAGSTSVEGPKDQEFSSADNDHPNDWEGDGSVELSTFDDAEWGSEAPARGTRHDDEDAPTVLELAGAHESLTDFLHQQALLLRLSEIDRCALRFLIENLNDDGYLEDSLDELAIGLVGSEDLEQLDELVHRFKVALHLLQSLEPVGVGARDLAECLRLQLRHLQDQGDPNPLLGVALQLCAQPLDLLARRDVRKLMQLCGLPEAKVRAALGVIARLEPKPGRRFVDVERHVIVPDVIVKKTSRKGGDGLAQFSVQLNPDVMPRLRVHDVYANALRGAKGSDGHAGLQQRLQEARWFIKNVQQRQKVKLKK